MGLRPGKAAELVALAETARLRAMGDDRDAAHRAQLGQVLTPPNVARRLAEMIGPQPTTLRVLDAGAGCGALTAALCEALLQRRGPPKHVQIVAYEIEPAFHAPLRTVLDACRRALEDRGIGCRFELRPVDFLKAQEREPGYDLALSNPPYRKLRKDSPERRRLSALGIEVPNLYAAFLALLIRRLAPGGRLAAITPRSFCNGPYFLPFRRLLLAEAQLAEVLLFDARDRAFSDAGVLQETLLFSAYKGQDAAPQVRIRAALDADAPPHGERLVPHDEVAPPEDPQRFLYLASQAPDEIEQALSRLPAGLADLGLQVSTGRVVDFRVRDRLRAGPSVHTAPLLYPAHLCADGQVQFPRVGLRKPQYVIHNGETAPLFLPAAPYVLLKRFSAKEQRRRLMPAVYDPSRLPATALGIENHLNVFWGAALSLELGWGLCLFLSASCVDRHFRVFSGHTQVNATDLRSLRYPSREVLTKLGRSIARGGGLPPQDEIDRRVAQVL